jgi:hypothetical protein
MKKKVKASFGYFTDKNSVVLTNEKPNSDNYLKDVKINLNKKFKMKAKSINEVKFSFDKPLSNIEETDLVYKNKDVVAKRSVFSKLKKEDHLKAGVYENSFKYKHITNNLNISIV